MKEVYTPKSPHEKAMQRALIQYRNPKNYDLVLEALTLAGREDLIGYDKRCLIRPKEGRGGYGANYGGGNNSRFSGSKSAGMNGSSRNAGKGVGKSNGNKNAGAGNTANKNKADAPKKKKTIRNVHKKK